MKKNFLCFALGTLILLSLLAGPSKAQSEKVSQNLFNPRADLSRLVVVGDSLSAGFQNGSLLESQQPNGYASLVARNARTSLDLPLIASPGVPNVLQLISPGPPPIIQSAPGVSIGRTNPLIQTRNLAVPGAKVLDALTTRPNLPVNSLTDLVLGIPGLFQGISRSQVEWAEALQPTTIFLWIGNNDALGAALAADPSLLTPQAQFEAAYQQIIDRLSATGAKLVVANIPDVTIVPNLINANEVSQLVGLPLSVIGPPLGISQGDFVTPNALPLIAGILANPGTGPLPANVVLTASETQTIRTAVNNFNRFIAAKAREKRAAFVDIHGVLNFIDRFGFFVGFRFITTDFLGGVFSLDGVHPTNTGYAIIANEFIKALALRYFTFVTPVNVFRVAREDPLVLRLSFPLSERETEQKFVALETANNVISVFVTEKEQ